MTNTATITTATIERSRDKYGRSVHRYIGQDADRNVVAIVAIVRLPATAHTNPEHPAYGQPYMVNLGTDAQGEPVIFYTETLSAARRMVATVGWTQAA